jgi:hypothetical protein
METETNNDNLGATGQFDLSKATPIGETTTNDNTGTDITQQSVETGEEGTAEAQAPIKEVVQESGKPEGAKSTAKPNFSDFLKEQGKGGEAIVAKPPMSPEVRGSDKAKAGVKVAEPREFTGIEEADIPLFKEMSNGAFNLSKKIYLENKALKETVAKAATAKTGELPPSYYSNPNGYLLSPKYQQAAVNTQAAEQVKRHWEQQLINIRQGKSWTDLTNDDKGNIVKSQPKEATAEGEVEVLGALQFAQDQLFNKKKELDGIITNFSNVAKEGTDFLETVKQKYFQGYEKDDHPTRPTQKAILESLPESYRDHPLAQILAMTGASNAILQGQLLAKEKELKKLQGIKQDTTAAQPTKKEFVAAGARNGTPAVKFTDFLER